MNNESTILYQVSDGIATITLNRPQVFNAFNAQMHRELLEALERAVAESAVRCIVLTGAGRAFCSGQDLKDVSGPLGTMVQERYNPLILKLRALPKPVVAAINGTAAGAGFSLALACDFRIAVESARFVTAFVGIGLVPDSGMTYFLPRLIGPARALELCMLGGMLDAPTALSYGMLNQVSKAETFQDAVRQFAERLANGPTTALRLMKQGFELSLDSSLSQVLAFEADAQQQAGDSLAYAEGLKAFSEKRAPNFRG